MKALPYILLFLPTIIFGQFSRSINPYINLLSLNPSFTGGSKEIRVQTSFLAQWPQADSYSNNSYLALDAPLLQHKSAFGIAFENNSFSNRILRRNKLDLTYAYDLSLNDDYSLKLGVMGSYRVYNTNTQGLIFPDQIFGTEIISTNEPLTFLNNSQVTLGTGFLFAGENVFMGVAYDNLANDKTIGDPGLLSINAALRFKFEDGRYNASDFVQKSIQLGLFYNQSRYFKQLTLGGFGAYAPLSVGLYYVGLPFAKTVTNKRRNDALSVMIGFRQKDISLSYNLQIPFLFINGSGGVHQLTFTYRVNESEIIFGRKRRQGFTKVIAY